MNAHERASQVGCVKAAPAEPVAEALSLSKDLNAEIQHSCPLIIETRSIARNVQSESSRQSDETERAANKEIQCAYEAFCSIARNPLTEATYRRDVDRFLAHLRSVGQTLHEVTPARLQHYLDGLSSNRSGDSPLTPATRRRVLAAIRAFYSSAVGRGIVKHNPAISVPLPHNEAAVRRAVTVGADQIQSLFHAIDIKQPAGLRDRAALATIIYAGARAGAVAELRVCDLLINAERWRLTIKESHNRVHEVPCHPALQQFLMEYVAAAGIAGDAEGPLFRSVRRGGRDLTTTAMPVNDVCRMVKRRVKDAGLSSDITTHSLRLPVVAESMCAPLRLSPSPTD